MTNEEAIAQLETVARICTTTALSEACLMGARALEKPDIIRCANCYWWGRVVHYKDGSTAIDCKLGYSGDPYGYCHRGKTKYTQVYGGEHEQ